MIGKLLGTAGKGFKSIGAGLSTGSLSNPKIWKGLGMVSIGMLGTTALLKTVAKSRDKMRQRRGMDKFRQF